jgi:copper chaperone CopZ
MSGLNGVTSVEVDKEKHLVKISYNNITRNIITDKLDELGYPEVSSIKK